MVAITIMASADSAAWAKARNAPCPRGFMQVIPRPPPRARCFDDYHFRAWARRGPSRLDRSLGHDDGVAADGRGDEPSGGDLGREADQARPAHLVALLDHERVAAVAQAARAHAGKRRG